LLHRHTGEKKPLHKEAVFYAAIVLNDRTDLFKDVLASAASLNIALEIQGELAYAEML
jgi:hypothetical protein